MRHFFLSLAAASAALLCGIGTAHAVPAKPGLIQVTQSDGTQLTVRLVGDERRHYMLSSDGYTLTGGPDGDLYYAELSASGKLIPTKVKARPVNALTADEKAVVSRLGKELKPTYVKPMVMPAPQQTQAPRASRSRKARPSAAHHLGPNHRPAQIADYLGGVLRQEIRLGIGAAGFPQPAHAGRLQRQRRDGQRMELLSGQLQQTVRSRIRRGGSLQSLENIGILRRERGFGQCTGTDRRSMPAGR